ncbi:class I SAM-dependent methyltransferase [Candidatus Parcubacteria bacterium]|nr:class I SAM-dependent methyltransferase [Candidatus Parcubacteria bacterium]
MKKYLDLGKSALANSYLIRLDSKKPEPRYPLRVFCCSNCHLAQLIDIVDRKQLFDEYAYFSSTSPELDLHFKDFARHISQRFPDQTKRMVLDIGSNDGVLLKHFRKLGSTVLGIDPAKNVAETAQENGIPTLPLFFDHLQAEKILKKYGPAGIITSNNTLAHTDNLHNIFSGIKKLLDIHGVFVFEVHYVGNILKKKEFDNTYHEHICYYSLAPILTLLAMHTMNAFDVEKVETHGGSIRVYASHPNVFPIKPSVKKLFDQEKKQGLHTFSTYKKFSNVPQKIKKNLTALLQKYKKQGKKIAGYGASAKGTTLLQYCQLGPQIIDYIVDNAPSKQGKYTPGSHIPIKAPEHLKKDIPDIVVIFAWNYANSIMKKEAWLKKQGVKFVIPIPDIKVI